MTELEDREELARQGWGLLVSAAQRHLETSSRELERLGMSKVMAASLNAIATMPLGPTHQLATRFGINPAWVTDIVDRLEKRGDVVRSVAPDDRRVKLLELTESGRSTNDAITAIFATPPPGLVGSPLEDLRALVRIAERISAADPDDLPTDSPTRA
jgi:DNA-binding MarR family transcriptional regulator